MTAVLDGWLWVGKTAGEWLARWLHPLGRVGAVLIWAPAILWLLVCVVLLLLEEATKP